MGARASRSGRGPAGPVLDRALNATGLDRSAIYITHAAKHFKHERRGKRRLHKRANRDEIEICRWRLDQDLLLIRPRLAVALGALAASALMRRTVVLTPVRGRLLHWADGRAGLATIHPSAERAFSGLVRDLRRAAKIAGREPANSA